MNTEILSFLNSDFSPAQAREFQKYWALKNSFASAENNFKILAAADVAFSDHGETAVAAIVLWDLQHEKIIETVTAKIPVRFPYITGLLAFREIPALWEAYQKLTLKPDVILCDGQGIAHPRRFGIACHFGLLVERSCIGVGKSRLYGQYTEPLTTRGAYSDLIAKKQVIGRVLRTRDKVKPLFVSVGHQIDLETACTIVLSLSGRVRLPFPLHIADRLSKTSKTSETYSKNSL